MNNIWLALLTGLTTGALSCLVVQGGLLASSVTQGGTEQENKLSKLTKVGSFLIVKIIAYTTLGFGLGALGSTFLLSPKALGFMQIGAGIFMLVTAARLLNLHPIFRYFVIQPPKFVYRILKKSSLGNSVFAPATLGLLTVFIPCGVTQAMMALAIASGNPASGAGIMFAFTLGTSPIFFAMGMAITQLLKRKAFIYTASLAIVFLGFLSINTGQVLRGSVHTAQNYWLATKSIFRQESIVQSSFASIGNDGKQNITINVGKSGYSTSNSTLKAGLPVKLKLITNNVQGCTRAFTIPTLNITKVLPETGVETLEFTPQKAGMLAFSCSMGMYTGSFTVVN